MTTLSIKYFDTHEFVKKSKEYGSSEELAEYQVKQIEKAIEVAVQKVETDLRDKDLATKQDISEVKKEIYEVKSQIIIWVAGMFLASGLIQHFFK